MSLYWCFPPADPAPSLGWSAWREHRNFAVPASASAYFDPWCCHTRWPCACTYIFNHERLRPFVSVSSPDSAGILSCSGLIDNHCRTLGLQDHCHNGLGVRVGPQYQFALDTSDSDDRSHSDHRSPMYHSGSALSSFFS